MLNSLVFIVGPYAPQDYPEVAYEHVDLAVVVASPESWQCSPPLVQRDGLDTGLLEIMLVRCPFTLIFNNHVV